MPTILKAVEKLVAHHRSGRLQGEVMPEDANPGLAKDSEENLRYFTLPMALNYQRDSYALWKSALAAYRDPETAFLFDPDKVVATPFAELQ